MENIVKIKYSNGLYEGEYKDYKREGKGKMTYTDGNTYEGNFIDGLKHGIGKMTYENGDIYEGNWVNDTRRNNGIMKYANGNIYEGTWLNDKRNGKGIMTHNGDTYDGDWLNNKRHGKGSIIFKDGTAYVGDWLDSTYHGIGKMIYINGDVYEGTWVDNQREGKGKMIYANGDIYEGNWLNNKRHGYGIIIINGIEYPGTWINDIQQKEDQSVKSIKIKNQKKFGTCWAHGISRTFVRTLQILGVILSEYSEDFYLLFYSILVEHKDCNKGGKFEDMVYLFNYLKDNYKTTIFDIKNSQVNCFNETCSVNDNSILNLPESIKTQFISNLEYLFVNNLLFLAKYKYDINVNGNNKPTKAIKTMLDYRLQPYIGININSYLYKIISEQNNQRKDIFPLVQAKDNIHEVDSYKCIDDTSKHAITLRRWKRNGVEFKNSWGENKASVGNFSVPDLKYLVCKKKDGTYDTIIDFSVLMFDYNNLVQPFKEIVDNNIKKYQPTIDNSLEIEENKNYTYESENYGFLNGECELKYYDQTILYRGKLINGIKNGNGIFRFINGVTFEGFWENDSLNGFGIIRSENSIYEGDFKNDTKNGRGKITYKNGDMYEGYFKDDSKNGQAKMRYKNGDIYEGNWLNGDCHGICKMTYINGNIYEGNWNYCNIDNKGNLQYLCIEGEGNMIYKNGNIYDGNWKNNKKHGKGIMTSRDGTRYDGDWLNDKCHGRGKMTYANGDIYEGDWVNDKRHGRGKMTYANGDIYEGNWVNDEREIIHENDEFRLKSKYLKYKKKYLELKSKFKI